MISLLFGAGYYAYQGWTMPGEAMPDNGYIALGLGFGLSLIVGCRLMVLLFYSSRNGYDDPPALPQRTLNSLSSLWKGCND